MADLKGFMKFDRVLPEKEKPEVRVQHWQEFYAPTSEADQQTQAARCMDCGVPFCHSGCPLGNIIPDFNDAVYRSDWRAAYDILRSTNNFPEFTGRICPAPCESACVLGINNDPVAIEHIEKSIVERAFAEGWVVPEPPLERTGKKVAVVGSGPAGLAAADQLNQAGHTVTIFERNDRIGGLLRYGIPDFKLEKNVIDRRLAVMQAEGILFKTGMNVGVDVTVEQLKNDFDAVVLCGGSTVPRDLNIPGRAFNGVHFAMDYLEQKNRAVAGEPAALEQLITATDKQVVVIGGGDTGADCVGTSNRLGAASVTQIELLSKPPSSRAEHTPWPMWPMQLRTSTSHEEGCDRQWAILTKAFVSEDGENLSGLKIVQVQWGTKGLEEIPDTETIIPADLALLAVGFLHPQKKGMLEQLGLAL
ncbi:MAG: glutamate synthase subunit beta, partial [Bacteroidota bacterium]